MTQITSKKVFQFTFLDNMITNASALKVFIHMYHTLFFIIPALQSGNYKISQAFQRYSVCIVECENLVTFPLKTSLSKKLSASAISF
jgi:hypothetical protein